jgi:hypothetical protein
MMHGKYNVVYDILGRAILKKLLGPKNLFFFSRFFGTFWPKTIKISPVINLHKKKWLYRLYNQRSLV